jgi:hypothetical protein
VATPVAGRSSFARLACQAAPMPGRLTIIAIGAIIAIPAIFAALGGGHDVGLVFGVVLVVVGVGWMLVGGSRDEDPGSGSGD